MKIYGTSATEFCPVTVPSVEAQVRQKVEEILTACRQSELPFYGFEKSLFVVMAVLGRLFVQLYLTARHERLSLQPYLENGEYRLGDKYAERSVKTAYGTVRFGRTQLVRRRGGSGFYPLDAVLGLTRDRLSPWMMQLVGRLATRMSFASARLVCKAVLCWSPATETIEQVVLGLGRQAAPFMQQLAAPTDDGEVLVIEADGKCPPMATEAELVKRRGKRRCQESCVCGCQRHRGKCKRQARGPKKRRKKGNKSKNGREAVVVVMYTLKREDGKLHGPINKRIWGTFAGRKAAALWARAQASKRDFGPDTNKTVQIIVDGATGLKSNLELLFPKAIITLDVCHVVERLWTLGHHFHVEGSEELKAWVEDLKTLLYTGRAAELVERLRDYLRQVPLHGPGTKGRRRALEKQIGYLEPRLEMMHYREWLEKDFSGMRWTQGKAEPLLHLRCIELNGDWDHFFAWAHQRYHEQLQDRQRIKILTDQPVILANAA